MPQALVPFPSEELSLPPHKQEEIYVHQVYDSIAPHFSQTRYKPWPIIALFLGSLSPGSIGLDSGTGNGKYLPLDQNGNIFTLGLDRSINLLRIAQTNSISTGQSPRETILGDILDCCWRPGAFDYAISIATLHHLVTHDRRKLAVQSLLRSIKQRGGRLLIYVWAVEQDQQSKRVLPSAAQDVLVPWILSNSARQHGGDESIGMTDNAPVFQRFYHFFERDELRNLVMEAAVALDLAVGKCGVARHGVEIVQEGWERSNLYIELQLWETSQRE